MEKDTINNPELQLAYNFVQYTDKHIFLTGKAGTGKTTFLQDLKNKLPKRMIVVAPTGVAAINAGGVTIHSFFQLPFGPILPGFKDAEAQKSMKFSAQKRNIIKSLDLLIIDEISMVRADLLDGIDEVLRRFRRNEEPFGGVQMLMIGDMQQLPPVVKDNEWSLLQNYYDTAFFFSSLSLKKTEFITINLKHVYRQKDEQFLKLLNKIRDKDIDNTALQTLNERYKPDFDAGEENYIILTTHNARAQAINNDKLSQIKEKPFTFKAEITGNFSEYNYPTDENLTLKLGSQVMFIKNDPEPDKKFFNGKIGVITNISKDEIIVKCPEDEDEIEVHSLVWDNIKYSIDETTKEINEKIEGTFKQIPLKPAWAITIHKSQGLTFDKAIIDSEMAFAHGQVYVALSRCRSLEGLVLSTPFSAQSLKSDNKIESFTNTSNANQPDVKSLEKSKAEYIQKLLFDLFNFRKLRNYLQWLRKLTYENKNAITPGIYDLLDNTQNKINTDIYDVGERFQRQLKKLLKDNADEVINNEIQVRIKKAVEYFIENLNQSVVQKMGEISIESDNKEIAKKIEKTEKDFGEELNYKLQCLNACTDGFFVKEYLQERAIAAMDIKTTKKKTKKPSPSKEIHNPDLYALIKSWRDAKAHENNLSHYMVLPLKTMRALSNQVPTTTEELKMIHGLGRKKLENYGSELLELINEYNNNHDLNVVRPEPVPQPKKEPKIPTHEISFNLWKQYKDVEKVAQERGFVYSTILKHLSHYVGNGSLDINELVDSQKVKTILEVYKKDIDIPLSDALQIVGDDISYDDLRLVKHYVYYKMDQNEL